MITEPNSDAAVLEKRAFYSEELSPTLETKELTAEPPCDLAWPWRLRALPRSLRHVRCGSHDGFDNLFIPGATTNVAVHKMF
jgi:hypothetical protein